jgi:cytoskeletal protein CcmA (bactofilin family)
VVSIRGVVSGRVQGRQRIEVLAGARVQATLVAPRLVIEEGAFFQGECDMAGGEQPGNGGTSTRPRARGGQRALFLTAGPAAAYIR